MNGFDERQLLCLRFNEPGRRKEPSHRTAPHRLPGRATATARPGEASERARVWFTVLLLPASQVVYMKSTF
jgi:hypothetical protein